MKPPVASVRCSHEVPPAPELSGQRCGCFLVDVEVETEQGRHLELACPVHDGPLELINVVQQLWRRKGAA